MQKTLLVIKREYLTRVYKKSFLLTTLLVPLLMAGFYAAIIAIAASEGNGKSTVAVIDEAKLFDGRIPVVSSDIKISLIKDEDAKAFIAKFEDKGFDAYLHISPFNIDSAARFRLYSGRSEDLTTRFALEGMINDATREKRLKAIGMSAETYASLSRGVEIENKVMTEEGDKTSVAELGYIVSVFCGMLIYIMMLVYGTQVMRGVMEEKTNRISEVMVSSIKPFQLMLGKIIGIGAVGLTQFMIWIVLLLSLSSFIPMAFPGAMETASRMPADGAGDIVAELGAGFQSLPILKIVICFVIYFLLGYLTYAALFAAIGSAVGEDSQDAQQLIFPVMMPIIIGLVIMNIAAREPYEDLALFGSYFPLTSPIVMMARVSYDIPVWEISLSVGILIACFLLFTWIAGRVYRVGILMYGKKAGWKEIIRWAFRKN